MVKFAKTKPFDGVEEVEIEKTLLGMEKDISYSTVSRYVADTAKYPNNLKTFSQKHMEHLKKFPDIDPDKYIANLKLMTKIRS